MGEGPPKTVTQQNKEEVSTDESFADRKIAQPE